MRARILQAAAQVIGRNGTDRTTIDDFIIAAGASRGTFYNHFESRQALLDELWRIAGRDPFRDIGTIAGRIECPAARFAATSRMVLRRALGDSTWGWLVVALSASEATLTEDLRAYPVPDLREAKRTGRFKYDDEKAAVDLVVGTMRGGLRALLEEERDATYADSLCRMLLLALGVASSEARRLSAAPLPDGGPASSVFRPDSSPVGSAPR
ncbi:TetR/AcrR family transcriptional regulator [Tardiphaga robiniae]|uniref:TetR/AcrR family transcriptional regulator n=1 Tax=Tardiphaga robiniae TaxID=943830 RepID=UPI001585D538|nr:TetR/AcrR family transcriptional regulator [Tardiphaga robiniae]NUU42612.1 TetR/AcrR family transcriptional regulator [Tardiphaga robiniae]